ncbi:hypothetical protein GCM10010286_30710 [Streptomyces toxytricini]|nr:hypothetical protein GCM10010286_30710 [Streptomyces toxytricini]
MLSRLLRPGGRLLLVYGAPEGRALGPMTESVRAALHGRGFRTASSVRRRGGTSLLVVTADLPHRGHRGQQSA